MCVCMAWCDRHGVINKIGSRVLYSVAGPTTRYLDLPDKILGLGSLQCLHRTLQRERGGSTSRASNHSTCCGETRPLVRGGPYYLQVLDESPVTVHTTPSVERSGLSPDRLHATPGYF